MSHQKSRYEGEPGKVLSILERPFVEPILEQAQENPRRDGFLAPVLFFRTWEGEGGVVSLELPDTTEKKHAYFKTIGLLFLTTGNS